MKAVKTSGRKWWYWLLPIAAVLVWLAVGAFGGPTFGKLSEISDNNQADFLPASADSTKVQNLQKNFSRTSSIPAIAIVESKNKVQPSDIAYYSQLTGQFKNVSGVAKGKDAVVGPIPSKDGKAIEFIIQISSYTKSKNVVANLRDTLDQSVKQGDTGYITGPAGLAADLIKAFGGIDGILLYVALGAVFTILLLVYRSIILPFVVLLTASFALSAAGLAVYHGVQAEWFKLNGQSQGILSILVIGAATDYSLLLTARYREALEYHESRWESIKLAYKRSLEPIIASGATVILGLLCLLLSDLNSNKSLGPVASFGIFFSVLAALSFLPAVLLLFGRGAFWPFKPKVSVEKQNLRIRTGLEGRHGLWRKIPQFVADHSRSVWAVCLVALLLCVAAVPTFKADGVSQTDTILGKSNAVAGQQVLGSHFPAGSGSPAIIIANAQKMPEVINTVKNTSGISYVQPLTQNGKIIVSNNQVSINATLKPSPDSPAAKKVVNNLRNKLPKVDSSALVGGTTAILIDTNQTAKNDLHKIIPIVLAVILVILILLLRSILAPVLLIASVILSFAATIGISALVFNHILHFPGSDAAIPLFGFIFLVALGVDYNIFLMTRVREESALHSTKAGILRGLSVTGSVITSAGIVLAATFASLAVVPILFLVQIAFIVSFGVLLDTIIVRSLLVPAVSYDIGKSIWWPSKLSRSKK